jgi:P27 family predicted phage terminase small subunit
MGARGPAATPKSILKARGSWRGQEQPGDVACPVEIPPVPDDLTDSEREVWSEITSLLFQLGIIGGIDRFVLRRYCREYVHWQDATEHVRQQGCDTYEVIDKQGNVRHVPYPQVAIANQLSASLLKMEQQFGMTASARSRVKQQGKGEQKQNDKSRFFAS